MTEPQFPNGQQTEKTCPHCGSNLVVRTNRANDSQFLACPRWPECSYTSGIPEDMKMRAAGQRGLFDLEATS